MVYSNTIKIFKNTINFFIFSISHHILTMQHSSRRKGTTLNPGTNVSGYIIQDKIGQGGFGSVYHVTKEDTDQTYAMKFERSNSPNQTMLNEIRVLFALSDSKHFPKLIEDGVFEDYHYYVMDLYGPSIGKLRKSTDRMKLSIYTVLSLGIQMLNAIEELHSKGYVHCDIKPSNFLINPDSDALVTLVDFGLSECFIDPRTKKIRKYERHTHFSGTYLYSSVNAQKKKRYAPRDDLISWFYSLVEMKNGKLPWSNASDSNSIKEQKQKTTIFQLCSDLPLNFYKIFFYISHLKYSKRPNYSLIRKLMNEMISDIPVQNRVYDWEKISDKVLPMRYHSVAQEQININ